MVADGSLASNRINNQTQIKESLPNQLKAYIPPEKHFLHCPRPMYRASYQQLSQSTPSAFS